MYKNPIVLRDLRVPLLARRARHTGPCGPYYLPPVGDRNGTMAGGWGEYQYTTNTIGKTLWELRIGTANVFLLEAGRYLQARTTCYSTDGGAWFPVVVRLNRGRGFLAGASMGMGTSAIVDEGIYTTPEDAAMAAHSLAERLAEADLVSAKEEL